MDECAFFNVRMYVCVKMQRMLQWEPLQRISAAEALEHPYFVSVA